MENKEFKHPNYGFFAFIPLIVFLAVYLGAGIVLSMTNIENPFGQVSQESVLLLALTIAVLMAKGTMDQKMDIFAASAGETGNLLMCEIFLVAGAFAGVASAMGGVESTVNLGLSVIPLRFLFAGIFIIGAFISTAMGTSMGTIAAIGPIAIGIAEKANISPLIAMAAVLGGAMFGDNLSIISDTTIAATRGAGCKMSDKFKMNLKIAIPAAIVTIIIYCLIGKGGEINTSYSFDIIKILPYVIVIVASVAGFNVIIILLSAIAIAGAIGFITGTLNFITFFAAIQRGMSGMFSITIIALLIKGVTGLVKYMGGLDWLTEKLTKNIKSRKGGEFSISALVSLVDAAIANNTIAILLTAPLTRNIAKEYNIAPKRVASLLDIFSCVIQGIIPHSPQVLLCLGMLGMSVSPLHIIQNAYYMFFLALAAIITIAFGLLRTKEEKNNIKLYKEDGEVIENP